MFQKNLGNVDRGIRIVIGLGLCRSRLLAGIRIGAMSADTACDRNCRLVPAYCPLGLSTCRVPKP